MNLSLLSAYLRSTTVRSSIILFLTPLVSRAIPVSDIEVGQTIDYVSMIIEFASFVGVIVGRRKAQGPLP